jgi:hypothetical protein
MLCTLKKCQQVSLPLYLPHITVRAASGVQHPGTFVADTANAETLQGSRVRSA